MEFSRRTFVVAAVVGLLMMSSVAGKAEEVRPIAFTRVKGDMTVEFLYEEETTKSESSDREFREATLKESVGMWTKGYIYHPNLFDFDLGLRFGLGQEHETGSAEEDRSSQLIGYNVHVAVEKKRPYGFEVFALRDQRIVQYEFAPNSIVDVTEYALAWNTRNRFLPTSVFLSTSSQDQEGIPKRREDEQKIRIDSTNSIGDFSRTHLIYEFRDFTEDVADINLQDHDFRATNTLVFDGGQRKDLVTSFRFFSEDGTNTYDQISANSDLTWEHSENLKTFYRVNLSEINVSFPAGGDIQTVSHSEQIGFSHKLYENLTTVGVLRNEGSDSDAFDETEYGGDIDFRYIRRIPIGQVRAHFGTTLEKTDRTVTGGLAVVVDEPHILTDVMLLFLNNINVMAGSIQVTNTTGTIIYVEGDDYTVTQAGNLTRIDRIITGQILDGQQILVDYLYEVSEDLEYVTTGVRAGAGITLFDKFSLDYRFESRTPDFISEEPMEDLVLDQTVNRVDAKFYEVRRSGLRYEVSSFYEDRESNISPVESYGIAGMVGHPFWRTNDASVSASYSKSSYPDTGADTDVFTVTGKWVSHLGANTRATFESTYRDIGGSIDQQTTIETKFNLETRFRLVRLSIDLSHITVDQEVQDRETTMAYIRVSREF